MQKQFWGYSFLYTTFFWRTTCKWGKSLFWFGNVPRAAHLRNYVTSSNVTQGLGVTSTTHEAQVASVDLSFMEILYMGANRWKHSHIF